MFRNKLDVDRHVAKTLSKVKNEKDRNFRAYSIARLYFDVGDYESCIKYAGMYLSVKDNNPAAHTLLGQAYHKLGQAAMALAEYKASLDLDPNQNNLILKVCELLGTENFPLDSGSARYWAERAAAAFPGHPALFALRARLLAVEGAGAPATLALLKSETNARPNDPAPHARLLRHLLQTSNPNDAFKYAFETNFSTDRFSDSPIWNEAVADVLVQSGSNQLGWDYWLLKLSVSERQAELSLAEGRAPSEAAAALWRLDRALFEASRSVLSLAPTRVLAAEALSHFGAQLCLHAASLLLKKAGREAGGWREAVRAAAPLLLLALQPVMPQKSPPVPSPSLPPASSERLLQFWYIAGAYRRSQAGHTLRACLREKKNVFLEKISQYCSGAHWRDKLYRKLFTNKEHLEKMTSSYLLTSPDLAEVSLRLPKNEDLKLPDQVAGSLRPASLHHQVWLGSNAENLADVSSLGMDDLRISVNNLSNCGAETLNRLDLDTFLYCTILTAKQNADSERKSGYLDPDKPNVLPAILTSQMCTPAQAKWWDAAWRVGGSGDLSDVRLTLTRGIEAVRCVGSHGLDPELLIEIARAFSKRGEKVTDLSHKRFLEARANLCYSAGVPLLERIRNNISIRPPEKRLFEYTHAELPPDKLDSLIEEGKLYLAVQCINDKDDDKAIEILETIKSPYASFHLYKIFKKLSGEITTLDKERGDPEKKARRTVYLLKAREFVYLTMDRLKAIHADSEHPLYVELGDHIENIEQCLSRIEPMDRNRHGDGNAYSTDDESWPGNTTTTRNSSFVSNYTPRSARSNRHQRRTEPQPSPESLEAQIRQLQRNNSIYSTFLEQTKILVESNKNLVEEVREMKKTLGDIKSHNIEDTIDQFNSLKLSVDEVKLKINEYKDESAADVADLKREISELKKEIGKVKNSPVERQQIDDNELFMLEEEAGAYFQRQPPAPVLPQPNPIYPPGALYPLWGQYPSVPQFFPSALFQDQALYSELLAPRSLPAPQPVPPPATIVAPAIVAPILPPPTLPVPILPAVTAVPPTLQATLPIGQLSQPAIHNYHIPLPLKTTASFPTVTSTSTPNKPLLATPQMNTPNPAVTFSLFDIPKPGSTADLKTFSFLSSSGTFDVSTSKVADKSRTISERSTDSYDPIPDYKPIIELPDEVAVMTGEENEEVLFAARAKLFRFISKEWKERGLGNIKLLKNKSTRKVRVLMRRERVHTICANHLITPDIEISPMKDRDKAYFWGANDFADQTLQFEKFCIRFKTLEIGQEFYDKFCKAIDESKLNSSLNESGDTSTTDVSDIQVDVKETKKEEPTITSKGTISVGGLKFFSTPTIKKVESPVPTTTAAEIITPNPFAGFTFNKTTVSTTPAINVFSLSKTTEPVKPVFNLTKVAGDVKSRQKETVLFENTGKVSSIEPNSTFYKDKGAGLIKILANTGEGVKLVVQQEKGDAIWCDHVLTKDIKFEALLLQLNTLAWKTPQSVSMRVTFPAHEVCERFKIVSAAILSNVPEGKKPETTTVTDKKESGKTGMSVNEPAIPSTVSGWGDKFKPQVGSWDCKTCYINNAAATEYCPACDSPKDPSMPKKDNKPLLTATTQKFTFGIPPTTEPAVPTTNAGWGDKFKPKTGSWDCKACYINNTGTDDYCVACNTPKDPNMPKKESQPLAAATTQKFTFGIPPSNGTGQSMIFGMPAQNTAPKPTSFTFGIPAADATPQNKTVSFADLAAKPALGFPQKNTFEFTLKTKSPVKDKDQTLNKSQDSDNEYVQEDDGDHITFAPIVPLPDKVEVKTGEEDEEVLYKHLAKLFRFSAGEWKECGVGDIKVLKHPETGKLRVLMRREPIHKICLNHVLNDDIKYVVKDDRTWLFSANDFSTGEIVLVQFCVRFKTKDIAQDFMNAIDKARYQLVKTPVKPQAQSKIDTKVESSSKPDDKSQPAVADDEVVFVSETTVSLEEKEEAKKLMLPENFYAYKQKEDCKGCVGCDPDAYVFKTSQNENDKNVIPDNKDELKGAEETAVPKPNTFIFGQKAWSEQFTAANTTGQSIFSTPGGTFGSGSIFSGKGDSGSIFSGKALTSDAEKKTLLAAPKLAIATTVTTTTTPTFTTGQPLFSSNLLSTNTPTTGSIFGNAAVKPDDKTQPTSFVFKPNNGDGGLSVFGNKDTNSVFKAPLPTQTTITPSTTASILFGNAAKSQESVFTSNSAPLFSTPAAVVTAGNIFGGNKTFGFGAGDVKPNIVFGQGDNKTSIFGGGVTTTAEQKPFGSVTVAKNLMANPENGEKEVPAVILGMDVAPDLSFAALAAQTKEVPPASDEKKQPFSWAGAGTPLFGGEKGPKEASDGHHNESHEGEGEGEYDPHYEPVVPMPEEINVVTGEEDEVVKFQQKAKLFRYDAEWKERGLGMLKLLYHPERKTYRLLLRQCQVHKVVLNQLLTRDLIMLPMAKNERALVWAGLNYTEDNPEGILEKLAVRFGNQDQTKDFHNRIDHIIEELEERAKLESSQDHPTVIQEVVAEKSNQEDSSKPEGQENKTEKRTDEERQRETEGEEGDEDDEEGEGEEEEYRYEDYYDQAHGQEDDHYQNYNEYNYGSWEDYEGEEEDLAIIYESQATVDGLSTHIVLYAGAHGGHLRLFRDKDMLSDTYITEGAVMNCEGVSCKWKGVDDEEEWKSATLPDEEVAAALHASFYDLLSI